MGSVMPLIAVWEILRKNYECIWIGGTRGIEKKVIKEKNIRYIGIPAGKIRKYLSAKNILAPFLILAGFITSLFYLLIYRPYAIIVSGSFISTPLIWASWILGIRSIVHQEDIKIGLSGRLTIPLASAVTTAFKETSEAIKQKNVYWIGNPIREIFKDLKDAEIKKWKKGNLPLILILGGGLGSERINNAVKIIAPSLADKAHIIHLTGKNKTNHLKIKNYTQLEYAGDELAPLMAAADIVVSRAGLSTIGELAFLGKPTILIPLQGVGQEENADYFFRKNAAVVVDENAGKLKKELLELLAGNNKREALGKNIKNIFPPDSAEALARLAKG